MAIQEILSIFAAKNISIMGITINGKTVELPNDNCSISVDKDDNIVITNNDRTTTIINDERKDGGDNNPSTSNDWIVGSLGLLAIILMIVGAIWAAIYYFGVIGLLGLGVVMFLMCCVKFERKKKR